MGLSLQGIGVLKPRYNPIRPHICLVTRCLAHLQRQYPQVGSLPRGSPWIKTSCKVTHLHLGRSVAGLWRYVAYKGLVQATESALSGHSVQWMERLLKCDAMHVSKYASTWSRSHEAPQPNTLVSRFHAHFP